MSGATNKIFYFRWKDGRVRHGYKGTDSENFKKQKKFSPTQVTITYQFTPLQPPYL